MKVLICVDIEGVCGVNDPIQTRKGSPEYEQAVTWMMAETNAAITGAFNGGAAEVFVVDAHGDFRNLNAKTLNPRARLLSGKPRQLGMLAGLELGINQVFFIGFHAAANRFGTLAHTINGRCFSEIRVSGSNAGEAELYGLMAGEYGAAVGLMTGDDCFIADATRLFTHTETVITKVSHQGNARVALHASPLFINSQIEKAAERATAEQREPLGITTAITIQISTTQAVFADLFTVLPMVERVGPKQVEFKSESMTYAIRILNAMSAMSASIVD